MKLRRLWFAAPFALVAAFSTARSQTAQKTVAQTPPQISEIALSAPKPTPVPTAKPRPQKLIKVGISTADAPLAFYSRGGFTIIDGKQPTRKLTVAPATRVQIVFGPNEELKEGAQTWRGPITIQTPNGASQGWQLVKIYAKSWPTRVSSNGDNPQWARPFRGDFQVWPQTAAEPNHRKGDLTLINVVPIEEYLKGVVPWEMSPSAPLEALKAQAICARTQTLAKIANNRHQKEGFDICDYDHCQGYPGIENEKPASTLAVGQTRGLAIFYRGKIADAVYGTNSGGITANSEDVWRGSVPYLRSVRDFEGQNPLFKANMNEADWAKYCASPLDSAARPSEAQKRDLAAKRIKYPRTAALYRADDWPEFYRWRREIGAAEMNAAFVDAGFGEVQNIAVASRTDSGRIKKLRIIGLAPMQNGVAAPKETVLEGDGAIRSMLSKRLGSTTALPSSTFSLTPETDASGLITTWILQGAGWGHGVGMCQRGAQNHALDGWNARKIVNWYFKDVQILDAM